MEASLEYRSQRVSYWYFAVAILLFLLQVVVGLVIASQYVWPNLWMNAFPFNVGRTFHLNLMVLWLVLGFMGGTYYMIPEETGRELFSPRLAYLQLGLLTLTGVAALTGFVAANFHPTLWLTEGREYIEAPRWADWLIVAGVTLFAFNGAMTIIKRRKPLTATVGILAAGMVGLAAMYLVGMRFLPNVATDQFLWWWVIHLWVEGTWELIAASLVAFLLIKLTGVDRDLMERWLYLEVGLVLLTGIIGTGHHYYWIGTPRYWLLLGAVFSALETVPVGLMVIDAWRTRRHSAQLHANRVALTWISAGAIMHFLGAGVWGFLHTLPQINQWTHGTQITAAHGHFAFFGAYAMLVIAFAYYVVPQLKANLGQLSPRRSMVAFWLLISGMLGMIISLTVAGIVQVYLERMSGMDFILVKTNYLAFWFAWRLFFGSVAFVGVLLFVRDFLGLGFGPERGEVRKPEPGHAAPSVTAATRH